jgi:hypothetical protein
MRRSERLKLAERRRHFTELLLTIYYRIAEESTDPIAAAAIRGLCSMVNHATEIMIDYDLVGPPPDDDAEQALQSILDNWDDTAMRDKLVFAFAKGSLQ